MKTKLTSVFLAVLLLFTLLPLSPVQSAGGKISVSVDKDGSDVKVHADVKAAFDENEYVHVLIKLKEQVDTDKVAQNAIARLSVQSIAAFNKKIVRSAVVDALRDMASDTQGPLLAYLNAEKDAGNVLEIDSFYIVNIIHAYAKESVVDNLAQRLEVEQILPSRWIEREQAQVSDRLVETSGNGEQWNLERIGAYEVWDTYKLDGTGVVVGIIDTGTHFEHEALKEKWRGYNANGNHNPVFNWFDAVAGKSMPYDINDASDCHGTHVTGTILGGHPETNNLIGVAPGAKWIAAKALDVEGGYDYWLLAAGQYMLAPTDASGNPRPDMAPDIINNSWGGSAGKNEWYRDMVKAWRAAQILPVFSAGNTSGGSAPGSVCNPANYPESFAVAATDSNNLRASFSNQGPGPYEGDIKPDLSAPGVYIRSSVIGGYSDAWSGTSMAAPHVAGVAALLLQADSTLSVDQMEKILLDTATPLYDSQYFSSPNYGYGAGLVNALEAVKAVVQGYGTITGQVLSEEGLAVDAVLTVVESGYSVQTDSVTGSYYLSHPNTGGETMTLRVEAYGYCSQEIPFTLEKDQELIINPVMRNVPIGSIAGTVYCSRSGDPVAGATITIVEDPHILGIVSDAEGAFQFDIYEGDYTLVISAVGYQKSILPVKVEGNNISQVTAALKEFIGYDEEIAYDDSSADIAWAYYNEGNGWGVRFTPKGYARITGANIQLWGPDWPEPGNNKFSIAVFDSGPDGNPGNMVIAPFVIEGVRGAWNHIDLTSYEFFTEKDFYIFYIQIGDYPDCPGLCFDDTSSAGRTYELSGGDFALSPAEEGNAMIRPKVQYALAEPVLTAPEDGSYCNTEKITVSGIINTDAQIKVFNNDVEAARVQAGGGLFQASVALTEGENFITASALVPAGETERCEPLLVIRDTVPPELAVTAPFDGFVTDNREITVSGVVTDKYLKDLEVNGKKTEVINGTFSENINLNTGANTIKVQAFDMAGNTTVKTLTIYVNTGVTRIFGNNRYGTAVATSQQGWPAGSTTVVLARGDDYADALAGVPLAYAYDAPILLTSPNRLNSVTREEIVRLGANKVVILGGEGAVSESVAQILRDELHVEVERISGKNRFATAAEVARRLAEISGPAEKAILAYGLDFPDALAAASYAAVEGYPILLVRTDVLTGHTETVIAELGIQDFVVVGGSSVISDKLMKQLGSATRVAGANRYATAVELAKYFAPTSSGVYLATGQDFADAITGGVLAAKNNSGLLLVHSNRVASSVQDYIVESRYKWASIFGGTGAVSDEVVSIVEELISRQYANARAKVTIN